MIGRSGSTLPDKNIWPVLGKPLLHYTAAAARRSKYIGRFYVSSDCPKIIQTAGQAGYLPIVRPPELSTADAQSVDAVKHALTIIEKEGEVEFIVVQHANVGTITSSIIDNCIEQIISDPTLSSVVPVHEKNEYHPFRCKMLNPDGTLRPAIDFGGASVSCNRQELPRAYFFDHSIWVLSVERGIRATDGQPPWTCMGARIKPYPTDDCFDVHEEKDIERTEAWILENDIPLPDFTN